MDIYRGHKIKINRDGHWIFSDTNNLVSLDKNNRSCGHCYKNDTAEGHDGCLGTLKGLMNACCGHGQDDDAYIQFLDTTTVSGKSALIIINELKKA